MFLAQRCGTRGDGFRFTHCDENNPGGIHSKNSWLLSAALWMFTCQLPPTDHFIRAMLSQVEVERGHEERVCSFTT